MKNIFEKHNVCWIGRGDNCEEHNNAPYLACNFYVNKRENVTLYVSGLGIFEASINGTKVSDTFFDPGESNFGKRVYYAKYDITNLVCEGENSVGIVLGNGQYTNFIVNPTMEKDGELIEPHRYQKNDGDIFCDGIYGCKKAICVITEDDEVILTSDENWFITDSPTVFQSWYGGEDYDATLEIDDWDKPCCDRRTWQKAEIMTAPGGILTERFFTPVRVCEKIKMREIIKTENGYVIDFGSNGAGIIELKLQTTPQMRGTKITLLPCEELDENNRADQRSSTQSWSETKRCTIEDNYTIKGTGEEKWQMKFGYHGFRYLEVKNMPYEPDCESFTYLRLRADNKKTGVFETDNAVLNRINQMTERSIESNMFFSFTDCPQIEKLGWLETSHLMFKSMAYGYDLRDWIEKIVQDMADSVFEDGYMPAIVPEFHSIRGLNRDVNWGGACIMTPWYYYEYYHDKNILITAFEAGAKYLEHLSRFATDDLIINYSQMGDWGQIGEETPTILVENCAYYLLLNTFGKICDILGHESAPYYEKAEKVKKAFYENSICYNKETGIYATASQSSFGCVLFSGMAIDCEKAVEGLVDAVKRNGYHLSSGEVGLKQVFATLHKYGYDDVVYKMVVNDTPPSYKYFADNNLTALPEYWNYKELWWGMVRSRNHAMMGHVKEWLTEGVLGINIEGSCVIVKPFVPPGTTYAKGEILCHAGKIGVQWHVKDKKITIDVSVPEGMVKKIELPEGYSYGI